MGREMPLISNFELAFTSFSKAGEIQRSATSSVLAMMAIRTLSQFGCQHVCRPLVMHSRSVGKLKGSLERRRKQAVRLFMRKGTGSIAANKRSVVTSAM